MTKYTATVKTRFPTLPKWSKLGATFTTLCRRLHISPWWTTMSFYETALQPISTRLMVIKYYSRQVMARISSRRYNQAKSLPLRSLTKIRHIVPRLSLLLLPICQRNNISATRLQQSSEDGIGGIEHDVCDANSKCFRDDRSRCG